jgi:hypothetical protein
MTNVVGCTLIVKDDFNNVLVLKKKVKRGQVESYSLITDKIRGKETTEKCVERAVKNSIKCIVFDMQPLKEFVVNEESKEKHIIYVGNIKERPMLDKGYVDCKWISKRQIEDHNFEEYEKEILNDIL